MVRIFKVEVSTNGRSHLLVTDNKVNIVVKDKVGLGIKRQQLKEDYEKSLGIEDLTLYLSYVEE
jgi:hypothetical protein